MTDAHIKAALSALDFALDEISAPYIPSAAEAKHLEAALAHLIAAFESRDFEPGEEAVWNCGTITIAGQHKGAWEIRLRQTDCDSDTRPEDGDAKQGSARE
jgi:hypothetical protein